MNATAILTLIGELYAVTEQQRQSIEAGNEAAKGLQARVAELEQEVDAKSLDLEILRAPTD